ncbi:aldose epimerase family protein [Teichococcus aestuarii]|uniref:aldose epimerase family protein n=1 Tax=Teichococcus aestuarii TaxID=568898 RepID=UPI00361680EB
MDDKPLLLRHGGASLALARYGAEPRSWCVEGQELLWNADPAWWPQTSPILFPVVGWTRGGEIRHEGRRYPMGVHGFAAASLFEAVSQGPAEARLRLRDTAESRARFPFAFCLTVSYRLMARGFSAGFAIHNPGAVPLPYALGLHPGFAWDPTVPGAGGHVLHFSRAERPEVPEIAPGGLFSARHRPVPLEGRRLRLSPGLLAREALCFLGLRSRAVCFHNGARGRIALRLENFPHRPSGPRPARPSSAWKPGPGMAIRKDSAESWPRSPRCAGCNRGKPGGTGSPSASCRPENSQAAEAPARPPGRSGQHPPHCAVQRRGDLRRRHRLAQDGGRLAPPVAEIAVAAHEDHRDAL